jgi:hypothetical protein
MFAPVLFDFLADGRQRLLYQLLLLGQDRSLPSKHCGRHTFVKTYDRALALGEGLGLVLGKGFAYRSRGTGTTFPHLFFRGAGDVSWRPVD